MDLLNQKETLLEKIRCAIPYSWKDKYYAVRDFFNPRQKWLTSKIGNGWNDKTELLKVVAFESIIHFVEEEEAFERIEWSSDDGHIEAAKAFKRAYDIVKFKLPILEKKDQEVWNRKEVTDYFQNDFFVPIDEQKEGQNRRYMIGEPNPAAKELLVEHRKIEEEIETLTQEVVETMAKYRRYLWT